MSIVLGYNVDMPTSLFSRKLWSQLLIILGLLLVIFLPRPLLGWWYLEKAFEHDSIGAYRQAAIYFENAAERCWWVDGLFEMAAFSALDAGDDKEALHLFQTALVEGDLTNQGLLALGDLYVQIGKIDSAISTWDLISLDSESASAGFFNKAIAQQEIGSYSSAMENWKRGLVIAPQYGPAHYNLGLLLMVTDPTAAIGELEQAVLYEQNLASRASKFLTILKEALQVDILEYQLVSAGMALAEMNEWKLAETAFLNAVKQNSLYAEAWAWLGESAQHLDKDPLHALQMALDIDSRSLTSLALAGLYHRRQGHVDQALGYYSEAASLEPENPSWLIVVGELSAEKGNLAEGLDYLSQAVRLSPNDPGTWRALLQFSVKYQIYVDSVGLQAARQLLQLQPESWESFDDMGQVLFATSKFDQAKGYFVRSIELDANQAEPHLHLGSLYLVLNMHQDARLELEKAFDLAPESPVGLQALRLLDQYFP